MANCNRQQLNITCGTDVVLHDKLMFDGEVFDPNVSVGIECNLVNSLGKRTSLEHEIADETLIIQIPWADGRNAGCYGLEVKGKCNGKTWATYADSLIRYTRATVEGAAVVETEHDWYDVTQVVSYRYSDSPLDEVDATIDDNYGEPSVTPTYEHNKLTLDFKNLRGNGIANVEQTTVSTEDEGVNEITITQDNGNTTVVQVRNGRKGTKGDKGNTGDSAIFDPTTGNISQMKQGTGLDELSPMSQKAVTDEIVRIDSTVEGYDETQESDSTISLTSNKYYNTSNVSVGSTWNYGTVTGSGQACKAISVTAGDKYKIYGKGNNAGQKQWVTLDSDKKVLAIISGAADSRVTPTEITITTTGYLVVNFKDYDSSTDKLIKIITTTVHHDGLTDVTEDHEERIVALEGVLPVEVEDSLTSSSTVDALSAKQGKVLNEKIVGVATETENDKTVTTDKYYNTTGLSVGDTWNFGTSTLSGAGCAAWTAHVGQVYRIYGKAPSSGAANQYVTLDSNKKILSIKTGAVNSRETPTELTIEQEGYLIVNFTDYDAETDKFCTVTTEMAGGVEQETSALDARVTALEGQGKPLTGKTIVCFGDSMTQFAGDVQSKRWTDFFEEITGATVINVAIGGARIAQRRQDSSIIIDTSSSGYTNTMNIYSMLDIVNIVRAACGKTFTGNNNYTYMELVQQFVQETDSSKIAAVARLADINWNNVNAVLIMGGGNDWNSEGNHGTSGSTNPTNTLGAINVIIESLLTTYKHLSIYIGTEYPVYGADGLENRTSQNYGDNLVKNGVTMKQVMNGIASEAALNHIPVCDLYNTLGWNEYNFSQYFRDSDNVHAFKGFRQVAEKIASFIIANKNF